MKLIDKIIEEWHDSDSDKDLHCYLGMSWEEYSLWVEENILPDGLKHLDEEVMDKKVLLIVLKGVYNIILNCTTATL